MGRRLINRLWAYWKVSEENYFQTEIKKNDKASN